MLGSPYALGTRTEPWYGHGCWGHRMLLEPERNHGVGMDAGVTVCSWNPNGTMVWAWMLGSPYALGTRTEPWFVHGCWGHRMLLEHERNHGLGMDALVIVCTTLWFGIQNGCLEHSASAQAQHFLEKRLLLSRHLRKGPATSRNSHILQKSILVAPPCLVPGPPHT